MDISAADNSDETDWLLQQAAQGTGPGLGPLLERHRKRLRRMVALRIDPLLQGRIDASDVVQDAFLEVSVRFDEYLRQPTMPFFLWLRFLTGQKLLALRRRHIGAQLRDAGREISLFHGSLPAASSAALAAQLVGCGTGPSEAAIRAERKIRLQEALNKMDPLDREVLALRHFEQLNNTEVAQVLELQESAASKRYVRALKKLKEILVGLTAPHGEQVS
jgi:RNA polymerase sigma-70 factor (ECF subfamily)